MSELEKLCELFGKVMSKEGKVSDHDFCPLVNTNLPEEICRVPKRMMNCPTDAFCCKDCPKFGKCGAQCRVAGVNQ